MNVIPVRLILASGSPRRHALLARLLAHEVRSPDVDEARRPGEPSDRYVARMAGTKARAVAVGAGDCAVLAADTIVVVDDAVLGKPSDAADARRMLRLLAGRTHEVLTAVHVIFARAEAAHLERAAVRFAEASDELLDWYVASGEPDDKAGAYAVQGLGAVLVERLEGNVQAVVGLPLAPLPALFAAVGLHLARDGAALVLSRRA